MIYPLFFSWPSHSQNYIKEKVGPNETIPWVQSHIKKGFEGNTALSVFADKA